MTTAEHLDDTSGYFSPDELVDRVAVGRTRAVLSDIHQIDLDTTSGEAFRKYVRMYVADLFAKLPDYRGEPK